MRVRGGIAADVLVAHQLVTGDDDLAGGHSDVHVMELVALDDAGAVGAGLLHVDDGGVQLGHGDGHDLLAGVEGVVHLHILQVVHLVQGLALLLADAPVLGQAGALHQTDRQEGKAQGGSMEGQHDHVLRVVLIGQLALLNGGAEAAGDIGIAGVGGVAVDVGLDAALSDHHVPVAAGRTSPDGEVALPLAQDLCHGSIGLAVGREAAEGDAVSSLDVFRDRIVQGVHFVHGNTPITKDLECTVSLAFFALLPVVKIAICLIFIVGQFITGSDGFPLLIWQKFAYLHYVCYNTTTKEVGQAKPSAILPETSLF